MIDTPAIIDCDIHPGISGMGALLPYLDDYWSEQITNRQINALGLASYPPSAPLSCREDWRAKNGAPPSTLQEMQALALDPFGIDIAICNPLYGGQVAHNWHMGNAICAAVNEWLAREWLDGDARLRGSIVVSSADPQTAVAEIEKHAADRRFVQVMLLVGNEMTLGRRQYWQIYEACERHGLPLALHAGTMYTHPISSVGWPTHQLQEYASMPQLFAMQLQSLLTEGVFEKFPDLTFVLLESGVTWLTPYMWRSEKGWKGLRGEVPWMAKPPSAEILSRVRLSTQPSDGDGTAADFEDFVDQLGSDALLLFATDFPHAQFEGGAVLPEGLAPDLVRRIQSDNPIKTYKRLTETV